MLKRTIKFTDYNDEEVEETFYFNLSKPELIELEVEYKGGIQATFTRLTETNDMQALFAMFKRIVLLSYGEKSEDGKRFVKSAAISDNFTQTPAYEILFMELTTDENAIVEFLKGVLPKDMQDEILKAEAAAKASPLPPTTN